jgi:hypothetical protein
VAQSEIGVDPEYIKAVEFGRKDYRIVYLNPEPRSRAHAYNIKSLTRQERCALKRHLLLLVPDSLSFFQSFDH